MAALDATGGGVGGCRFQVHKIVLADFGKRVPSRDQFGVIGGPTCIDESLG